MEIPLDKSIQIKPTISIRRHNNSISCAKFSPTNTDRYFTASHDGSIRFWNAEKVREDSTLDITK